jgi:hypothetical protein
MPMTTARRRRFRLVWEPDRPRPWIVQYDDGPQAWKDAWRFRQYGEAIRHIDDLRRRDRVLLEAGR